MSCCPVNSHAALDASEYESKGIVDKVEGLDIYRVGKGNKCIIWNYDIYGFTGGRTRLFCDLLADEGFMVILPDYYHGKFITKDDPGLLEFLKSYPFSSLKDVIEEIVIPYAKQHGAEIFGSMGTCWGSYLVVHYSSYPGFKAGVSMHPSHSPIMGLLDEDEAAVINKITCKQMIMSAGNDHENTQQGGMDHQLLKENVEIESFPDMIHGWTTRGDVADDKVKRDVHRAVQLFIKFFKENMN